MDRHRVKADIESISKTVLEQLTGSKEGDQKTQVVDSGGSEVDFATQTTLAAILAKIIAAPATEAKQDTALTEAQTLRGKQFPNVGIHVLTGTGAATAGTYTGFVVLEEAAISSITLTDSNKVTGTNDFSGITLSVGTFIEIPGGFSTLTLSSGSMILIKGA